MVRQKSYARKKATPEKTLNWTYSHDVVERAVPPLVVQVPGGAPLRECPYKECVSELLALVHAVCGSGSWGGPGLRLREVR